MPCSYIGNRAVLHLVTLPLDAMSEGYMCLVPCLALLLSFAPSRGPPQKTSPLELHSSTTQAQAAHSSANSIQTLRTPSQSALPGPPRSVRIFQTHGRARQSGFSPHIAKWRSPFLPPSPSHSVLLPLACYAIPVSSQPGQALFIFRDSHPLP